jgi:7-keto-8-aminopelargonate synthetase-like enzyme
LRANLSDLHIDLGCSDSHIIPLILKSEEMCLKLKKYLESNGYFVKAITSPTVMKGKERIRLSVTATMKRKKLEQFSEILKNLI